MSQHRPSPDDVGRFYDHFTRYFEILWGQSIHVGYWPDSSVNDSIANGQVRLTELMVGKLGMREEQHLLDVGCGTGAPSIHIARTSGCKVTGISVSKAQIAEALQRAAREGMSERLEFQFANAMAMPFQNDSFDAAWAFESLFHMSEPERALREIHRCLKPGGRLAIANFTRLQPMTPEEEVFAQQAFLMCSLHSIEEHKEILRATGFEVEEAMDIGAQTAKTRSLARENLPSKREQLREALGDEVLAMLEPALAKGEELGNRCCGYAVFAARKR